MTTKTRSDSINDSGSPRDESVRMADWDGAFWFAVFSPLIGILAGFLALVLFYH